MTQHIWTILDIKAKPLDQGFANVVFQIKWQCQSVKDKNGVLENGHVEFENIQNQQFIEYEKLTESQIWAWLDQKISRPEIEQKLEAQLLAKKPEELVSLPMPWNK
jgi:hypothetical protein